MSSNNDDQPDEQPNIWALDPESTKPLPRGRHALSRETVLASQRGRMLHAVMIVTAQKGYGYVSVGDVIAEAGVSRKAFYEHFDNFEECWAEAYSTAVEILFAEITRAVIERGAVGDREAALAVSIDVLTHLGSLEPLVAHASYYDVIGAGPAGLAAHQATLERHADIVLTLWDGKSLAESTTERRVAAAGAVAVLVGIFGDYLNTGRADELPNIGDQLQKLMIAVLEA